MTPFAAVLLAGGKSRRMGRDKALLPLPDGRALWERQLDVLHALEPAEWFVSGAWRVGFPPDLPWLADAVPGAGPLAGIAAALETMRAPRLVVLAVDLPEMTTDFLHSLLHEDDTAGVVPQRQDGFFEPLAAVYAKSAIHAAKERLHQETLSMQSFIHTLIANGQAIAHPISMADTKLFTNWNQPDDLRP